VIDGAICVDPGEPGVRPALWSIDARATGADENGLRSAARALSDELGRDFVSRTYAFPWALVAAHDGPVGVDLERVTPCSPALASLICALDEGSDPRIATDPNGHLTNLWSSKEALAKALGDALAYDPARLASPMYWPAGRSGAWQTRALRHVPEHRGWICWAGQPRGASRRSWAPAAAGADA
jgi:hypothetical protein